MAIDPLVQRRLMGRFATGVTLITARWGDVVWGMTANAILSLSLDPPRLLVSIKCDNYMNKCLAEGQCFAVNILGGEQEDIARRYAFRGPKSFEGLAMTSAITGAPIVAGALAYVDCRVVERVHAGDHDMYIGEPLAGEVRDGPPLLFFAGRYRQLQALAQDKADNALAEPMPADSYDLYASF